MHLELNHAWRHISGYSLKKNDWNQNRQIFISVPNFIKLSVQVLWRFVMNLQFSSVIELKFQSRGLICTTTLFNSKKLKNLHFCANFFTKTVQVFERMYWIGCVHKSVFQNIGFVCQKIDTNPPLSNEEWILKYKGQEWMW